MEELLSMLKKVIFLFLISSTALWAQPVLNSADMDPLPGTVINYEHMSDSLVSINLGSPGVNQSWNFTSVTTFVQDVDYYVDPSATPYADNYPDANRSVYTDSAPDLYNYFNHTSSDFWTLGYAGEAGGVPVMVNFNNTQPMISFPATYQDEWATVFDYDMGIAGFSVYDSTYNIIDAWGTVTDVYGTFPCLRNKKHRTVITYASGFPVNTITFWTYDWLVPGVGPMVSIYSDIGETNPNFTMGSLGRVVDMNTGVSDPGLSLSVQDFRLQPAYPNPFNPETNISFSLPAGSEISLVIYDANGNEVSTIANGLFSAGNHTSTWNAQYLPSGVYFARLLSGNNIQTQKLILLK